jgi:hypothetical protein
LDQIITVGAAANPSPANGATGIAFNSPLTWTPGSNAGMHAVYLGASSNAVAQAAPGSPQYLGLFTTNLIYPALNAGTTNYWRVDEIAGINTNTGTVWSFITQPAPTLLHQYSFSETGGTNTADAVGGPAWTGLLPNGGSLSGGKAVLVSSASQYVSLPAGIVGTLTNFSILSWVQLTANANWARLFDFGNSQTVYMFLTPQNGTTGKLRFSITTSGPGGEQQINGPAALSASVPHEVAVTLNGATGIMYVDGAPVGTNISMTLNPSSLGATSNNYLGKSQFSDPYLYGSIDEFRIYSVALSASDIAATYALGPNQLLTTNAPATTLSVAGANLIMSWPVASSGFALQSSTNLGAGNWLTMTSPAPQIVGTNYQVQLSPTNGTQFFRLSR